MGYNEVPFLSPTHLLTSFSTGHSTALFVKSCLRHLCINFQISVNLILKQWIRPLLHNWKNTVWYLFCGRESPYNVTVTGHKELIQYKNHTVRSNLFQTFWWNTFALAKLYTGEAIVYSCTASQNYKSSMNLALLALLIQQECDHVPKPGLPFGQSHSAQIWH